MAFEVYDDPTGQVRFYFSHSDEQFTTGVMVIQPDADLPKHNRPKAFENLVQISGKCLMRVFQDDDNYEEHTLEPGQTLRMEKGQWHIHANPFEEVSVTLFKAEGDITDIVANLRASFTKVA